MSFQRGHAGKRESIGGGSKIKNTNGRPHQA